MRNEKIILFNEQGFALMLAMFVVASVMVIGMSIMTVSMMSSESSGQLSVTQKNFQVADGASEMGKNWLNQMQSPVEHDPTYSSGNVAPYQTYTDWSNDINAYDVHTGKRFAYPEYRYRIDSRGSVVSILSGSDDDPDSADMVWYYYKITSESRSGQSAQLGRPDRTVITFVRRPYFEF